MFCSKCGVKNAEGVKFCKDCGNQIGTQPGTATPSELILPASLMQRFVNRFVDGFGMYIFGAISVGIGLTLFGDTIGIIIGLIGFLGYHFIFEALFQRTFGKMLTGTKVVNMQGEKPSLLSLLGRTLARYIPFEPLSFLFYGAYPTKGWHDRLSHTLVVPSKLTPEQVRSIDLDKLSSQKSSTGTTILIAIIGGFFLISIIGILASVVLASLNSARDKGEDAATKATLSELRVQAELYYDENSNSYKGFCLHAKTKGLPSETKCNEFVDKYAISSPLNTGEYYCIDSSGSAETVNGVLTTQTACSQIPINSATIGDSSTKTVYEELKEAEEYANSVYDLPAMIDEETRLDRIYATYDNKMNYDYSLVNYTSDELDWSLMEEIILPDIKNSFCYDSFFEYYREKNIPMKWNYYGSDKYLIGSIELKNSDCI